MDLNLAGKKLLLLGTNVSTCDMINYAKSKGVYVIVTDNLLQEQSPAKIIADESWMVSTANLDKLEELAVKNKVDGIFAGVSEFNLEKALTLCERLQKPFYATREQWNIASNKHLFKELCRRYEIPVVKEYDLNISLQSKHLQNIDYPIIIKPADNSGGIGITICENETDLYFAVQKAINNSVTKRIIAEKYISGEEFVVNYTLKNGDISLSSIRTKCFTTAIGPLPMPIASLYWSDYLNKYIDLLDHKVKKMFRKAGFMNGALFMQGKVNNDGFHFFEMGYRLSGASEYNIIHRVNGINNMQMIINYSLTGEMSGYELSRDNPILNKFCCHVTIFIKEGIIGRIIGIEEVQKSRNVVAIYKKYDVGSYVNYSNTYHQILFRFFIIAYTKAEFDNEIKNINKTISVIDNKGENMLYDPICIEV